MNIIGYNPQKVNGGDDNALPVINAEKIPLSSL